MSNELYQAYTARYAMRSQAIFCKILIGGLKIQCLSGTMLDGEDLGKKISLKPKEHSNAKIDPFFVF